MASFLSNLTSNISSFFKSDNALQTLNESDRSQLGLPDEKKEEKEEKKVEPLIGTTANTSALPQQPNQVGDNVPVTHPQIVRSLNTVPLIYGDIDIEGKNIDLAEEDLFTEHRAKYDQHAQKLLENIQEARTVIPGVDEDLVQHSLDARKINAFVSDPVFYETAMSEIVALMNRNEPLQRYAQDLGLDVTNIADSEEQRLDQLTRLVIAFQQDDKMSLLQYVLNNDSHIKNKLTSADVQRMITLEALNEFTPTKFIDMMIHDPIAVANMFEIPDWNNLDPKYRNSLLNLQQRSQELITRRENGGISDQHLQNANDELFKRIATILGQIQGRPLSEEDIRRNSNALWTGLKRRNAIDLNIFYQNLNHIQQLSDAFPGNRVSNYLNQLVENIIGQIRNGSIDLTTAYQKLNALGRIMNPTLNPDDFDPEDVIRKMDVAIMPGAVEEKEEKTTDYEGKEKDDYYKNKGVFSFKDVALDLNAPALNTQSALVEKGSYVVSDAALNNINNIIGNVLNRPIQIPIGQPINLGDQSGISTTGPPPPPLDRSGQSGIVVSPSVSPQLPITGLAAQYVPTPPPPKQPAQPLDISQRLGLPPLTAEQQQQFQQLNQSGQQLHQRTPPPPIDYNFTQPPPPPTQPQPPPVLPSLPVTTNQFLDTSINLGTTTNTQFQPQQPLEISFNNSISPILHQNVGGITVIDDEEDDDDIAQVLRNEQQQTAQGQDYFDLDDLIRSEIQLIDQIEKQQEQAGLSYDIEEIIRKDEEDMRLQQELYAAQVEKQNRTRDLDYEQQQQQQHDEEEKLEQLQNFDHIDLLPTQQDDEDQDVHMKENLSVEEQEQKFYEDMWNEETRRRRDQIQREQVGPTQQRNVSMMSGQRPPIQHSVLVSNIQSPKQDIDMHILSDVDKSKINPVQSPVLGTLSPNAQGTIIVAEDQDIPSGVQGHIVKGSIRPVSASPSPSLQQMITDNIPIPVEDYHPVIPPDPSTFTDDVLNAYYPYAFDLMQEERVWDLTLVPRDVKERYYRERILQDLLARRPIPPAIPGIHPFDEDKENLDTVLGQENVKAGNNMPDYKRWADAMLDSNHVAGSYRVRNGLFLEDWKKIPRNKKIEYLEEEWKRINNLPSNADVNLSQHTASPFIFSRITKNREEKENRNLGLPGVFQKDALPGLIEIVKNNENNKFSEEFFRTVPNFESDQEIWKWAGRYAQEYSSIWQNMSKEARQIKALKGWIQYHKYVLGSDNTLPTISGLVDEAMDARKMKSARASVPPPSSTPILSSNIGRQPQPRSPLNTTIVNSPALNPVVFMPDINRMGTEELDQDPHINELKQDKYWNKKGLDNLPFITSSVKRNFLIKEYRKDQHILEGKQWEEKKGLPWHRPYNQWNVDELIEHPLIVNSEIDPDQLTFKTRNDLIDQIKDLQNIALSHHRPIRLSVTKDQRRKEIREELQRTYGDRNIGKHPLFHRNVSTYSRNQMRNDVNGIYTYVTEKMLEDEEKYSDQKYLDDVGDEKQQVLPPIAPKPDLYKMSDKELINTPFMKEYMKNHPNAANLLTRQDILQIVEAEFVNMSLYKCPDKVLTKWTQTQLEQHPYIRYWVRKENNTGDFPDTETMRTMLAQWFQRNEQYASDAVIRELRAHKRGVEVVSDEDEQEQEAGKKKKRKIGAGLARALVKKGWKMQDIKSSKTLGGGFGGAMQGAIAAAADRDGGDEKKAEIKEEKKQDETQIQSPIRTHRTGRNSRQTIADLNAPLNISGISYGSNTSQQRLQTGLTATGGPTTTAATLGDMIDSSMNYLPNDELVNITNELRNALDQTGIRFTGQGWMKYLKPNSAKKYKTINTNKVATDRNQVINEILYARNRLAEIYGWVNPLATSGNLPHLDSNLASRTSLNALKAPSATRRVRVQKRNVTFINPPDRRVELRPANKIASTMAESRDRHAAYSQENFNYKQRMKKEEPEIGRAEYHDGSIEFKIRNDNDMKRMKAEIEGKPGQLYVVELRTGRLYPVDIDQVVVGQTYIWKPKKLVGKGNAFAYYPALHNILREDQQQHPYIFMRDGNDKAMGRIHHLGRKRHPDEIDYRNQIRHAVGGGLWSSLKTGLKKAKSAVNNIGQQTYHSVSNLGNRTLAEGRNFVHQEKRNLNHIYDAGKKFSHKPSFQAFAEMAKHSGQLVTQPVWTGARELANISDFASETPGLNVIKTGAQFFIPELAVADSLMKGIRASGVGSDDKANYLDMAINAGDALTGSGKLNGAIAAGTRVLNTGLKAADYIKNKDTTH